MFELIHFVRTTPPPWSPRGPVPGAALLCLATIVSPLWAQEPCQVSLDCPAWIPICDEATSTCVPCSNDSQCFARDPARPFCDSVELGGDGQCVGCLTSDHCAPPPEALAPICDDTRTCAACTIDAECLDRDEDYPACQPIGSPWAGACRTCSADNDTLCVQVNAVCDLEAGFCIPSFPFTDGFESGDTSAWSSAQP